MPALAIIVVVPPRTAPVGPLMIVTMTSWS